MLTPSKEILTVLAVFATAMTAPTFAKASVLIYGVVLTPGARTVCAALRVMGLGDLETYGKYHRVLNRDRWSPWMMSQALLQLLINTFVEGDAPLVVLIDETLERRRGEKIKYKGLFRDGVLSTAKQVVKSMGVRWACMGVLVKVPWCEREWALPFMVVPVLSPKTSGQLGKRHRTSIDWTRMMIVKVRRWQPRRELVIVGDGAYAAAPLVQYCQRQQVRITLITRLRIDACLYDEPAQQPKGKRGPKPKQGARLPAMKSLLADPHTPWLAQSVPWYGAQSRNLHTLSGTSIWHPDGEPLVRIRWVLLNDPLDPHFKPVLLLCSDPTASPLTMIACFVGRWNIEVTFEESRAHLGIETQRQWSDRAIERTTPCLFGVFSLVVVMAHRLFPTSLPIRSDAWYQKQAATYSDVLAAVRIHLWQHFKFDASPFLPDLRLFPSALLHHLQSIAAYA
jgi:hypothetical protein